MEEHSQPTQGDLDRRQHAATVVGVVVAGVLASYIVPGPYNLGSTMLGLILIAILFGYGELPTERREAVGYAAACGFAVLLTAGAMLDWALDDRLSGWRDGQTTQSYEMTAQSHDDGLWTLGWWAFFALCTYAGLTLAGKLRGPDDRRNGTYPPAAAEPPTPPPSAPGPPPPDPG